MVSTTPLSSGSALPTVLSGVGMPPTEFHEDGVIVRSWKKAVGLSVTAYGHILPNLNLAREYMPDWDKAKGFLMPIWMTMTPVIRESCDAVSSFSGKIWDAGKTHSASARSWLLDQTEGGGSWYLQRANDAMRPYVNTGVHLVRRVSAHIAHATEMLSEHAKTTWEELSSVAMGEVLRARQTQVAIATLLGGSLFLIILRHSLAGGPSDKENSSEADGTYDRTVLTTRDAQLKCSQGVAALTKAGVRAGDVVCECRSLRALCIWM